MVIVIADVSTNVFYIIIMFCTDKKKKKKKRKTKKKHTLTFIYIIAIGYICCFYLYSPKSRHRSY